jgi:hypothetical protein
MATFRHQPVRTEREIEMARKYAKKKRTPRTSRPGGAWISVNGIPYAIFDDGRVADVRSNLVTGHEAEYALQVFAELKADYERDEQARAI